ncbi:ABC transporter permease subunit [Actinomadura scrupuli]|uniref:ABC transporter permease subunit n=1 Tax=Actinomadura scrupuli TaxID=559629 RepID=UPI003D98472F
MTTATIAGEKAHGPLIGRLLLAEWTKLRSVRSTFWSLALLAVITLGFTALFSVFFVTQWDQMQPSDRAQVTADPAGTILGTGFNLSQLAICVLGVLVISSEYSTGMIRSTLLAVPGRLGMLVAKCVVFAVLVFVVAEVIAFPSFYLGAAILHSKATVSLSDPGVLRAIIGIGLYLAVLGLFSMAIGAIVRHSAGAITGVIGFVLVLAPLTQALPGKVGRYVHAYMPTEAGHLIGQAQRTSDGVLTPWQGFGVFVLWTVALLAVAAYLLKHRDA